MALLRICFAVLAVALLLPVIRLYLSRKTYDIQAKQRGCGSLPDAKGQGPYGIFAIFLWLKALYKQSGPENVIHWYNSDGKAMHTCRYNILGDDFIFTRDPENLKAMFVTQVDEYDHSDARIAATEPMLAAGVFNSRGEAWRHSRTLLRPQFSRDIISDLRVEERHLEDVWELLDTSLQEGWTSVIDLSPVFLNLTFGTSIEMLLGHKVNLQNPQDPQHQDTNDLSLEVQSHYRILSVLVYFKLLLGKKYWIVPDRSVSSHHSKAIREYLRSFITKSLEKPDTRGEDKLGTGDRFVFLDELIKETRDPVELENEILGVLSAGRATTSLLLAWAFYFLAREPRVFEKLRSAIMDQFGSAPGTITLKGLESCEYLRLVTRETLRVANVIPTLSRASLVDTTLPRGGGKEGMDPIYVPKGMDTRIALFAINRRVDIWGPDAEEFKPERWIERRAGLEFSPFGAGRKRCIGRKLSSPP